MATFQVADDEEIERVVAYVVRPFKALPEKILLTPEASCDDTEEKP